MTRTSAPPELAAPDRSGWFRPADLLVVAGLTFASGALRADALGQSSFWFDDAWVVLTSRADTFDEFVRTGFTTPLFNHGSGLIVRVLGTRVLHAQVVPFVAGSIGAGLAYLGLIRIGFARTVALAGATLVVVAPAPILYATRVKPYTLEVLATGTLLLLALALVARRGSPRAYVAVSAAGILVSGTVGITAVSALGAATVVRWVQRRDDRKLWPWLAALVAGAGAWWLLYLRGATTHSLREFWRDAFVETDSLSVLLGSLADRFEVALTALVPGGDTLWPLAVVVVVVAVVRRPGPALVVLAPVAATTLASALEMMPLGGGRTDIHLLPVAALLLVLALEGVGDWLPRSVRSGVALAVTAAVAVTGLVSHETPWYPAQDVRPLVAVAESRLADGGVIVVYPSARYAYGLYTDAEVDLVDDDGPNGFTVAVPNPSIIVPPPSIDDHGRHRPLIAGAVAGRDEVWYVGTFFQGDEEVIADAIVEQGFVEVERIDRPGAWARRFAAEGRGGPLDSGP